LGDDHRRLVDPYGGGTPNDGGPDIGSDASYGGTYVLAEWVGPVAWTDLRDTITVNGNEQVYVTTGTRIYSVLDGTAVLEVNQEQLMAVVADVQVELVSLDAGPDNKLYALHDYTEPRVLVLDAPGSVTLWGTPGDEVIFPPRLSVVSAKEIVVLARDGLFTMPPGGPATLIYGSVDFGGSTDCESEDLETTYGGFVFYLPGCTGNALYGGPLDGAGIGVLAENAEVKGEHVGDFAGVGRHPAGGVVVSVEGALYRFQEDGTFAEIITVPTLWELSQEMADSFHGRPVAVGPSGSIYLASQTTIYRAQLQ
jgi:hypothetical protein